MAKIREGFSSHGQVLEENAWLRTAGLLLQAGLLKFEALEQENLRLRGLLDISFKLGEQAMSAELRAVNVALCAHVVVVNKGGRFGVYPGQPVMDSSGVAGQVCG